MECMCAQTRPQFILFMGILFLCLIGCFSMYIWTPTVLSALYMRVFCIFVFPLVQRNGAGFTWKGALEIHSLLLLLLYSLYERVFWEMESEPMLTPKGKTPLPEKLSSEADRTHDAASNRIASQTHYQLSYSGPDLHRQLYMLIN